ncbi:MAG: ABC transporter permease, partial [Raoultibacter sp.]
LGFLVIYSNRFLIKRRKREFGIYLTLGMKPSAVSHIVLLETLIVGLVSFVVGVVLGIALSQGLSFLTASMFNVPMVHYQFVFSMDAFLATMGCFALIFVIVAIFNTFTVSRYKLIDLFSATSKSESLKVRSPWASLAVFVVSIIVLAASYILLIQNGLVMLDDPKFYWATILMIVGTTLFFYALAGFTILVIQRTRGIYFHKLNVFTLRQISSKVNTAFLSLSLVCVMLFFSITVFSCGMGMVESFTKGTEKGTQYDASLSANLWWDTQNIEEQDAEYRADAERVLALAAENNYEIAPYLEELGVDFAPFVKAMGQVDIYFVPGLTYGDMIDVSGVDLGEDRAQSGADMKVQVISVTQYNALRAMVGEEPIDVGSDGYAVNNIAEIGLDLSRQLAELDTSIAIAGHDLKSVDKAILSTPLEVHAFASDVAQLIVPDAVIKDLGGIAPYTSYLNVDYSVDREAGDAALYAELKRVLPPTETYDWGGPAFASDSWPVSSVFTAEEILVQAGGMRMMITYLALYIGFVFLITTAAVLAIQQLSEASDSMERYRLLSKLGCDRSMIAGSLRTQVLVYFLAPLGLAVCHSCCAIGVLSVTMFSALGVSIGGAALMTVGLVLVVYGSYMLVTYL